MMKKIRSIKSSALRLLAVASVVIAGVSPLRAERTSDTISVVQTADRETITTIAVIRDTFHIHENPSATHHNFYMSAKSNMLYDALAVPNLGVEFYLGKNWSLAANWMYAWWKNDHRHRYWRTYGGDIALRRWIGSAANQKPLTGHHLGIYAGVVTYDFEWGGTGYMGGIPHGTLWDRCQVVGGLEYGYSLPVGRRLNIDFTIAIGYRGGKYVKYHPEDGKYVWDSVHHINYFGPTRAEISLVWLIGNGNFNSRKGGQK